MKNNDMIIRDDVLVQYVGNAESVEIPDSIKKIDFLAFSGRNNLKSVYIPEGITYINDFTFGFCNKLDNITVDEANPNYKSVDGVLFNKDGTALIQYPIGKEQESYAIPDGVEVIIDSAFSCCEHLKQVYIPEGVTEIGEDAFSGCSNLEKLVIPDTVTEMGENAFLDCESLTKVEYAGTAEQWERFVILSEYELPFDFDKVEYNKAEKKKGLDEVIAAAKVKAAEFNQNLGNKSEKNKDIGMVE